MVIPSSLCDVLSVPIFRLKSRYMSVALRGSARGTLGTLRRTASLEYFLDCDKECDVEEVELATPPPRPLATSAQYTKVRREQMFPEQQKYFQPKIFNTY